MQLPVNNYPRSKPSFGVEGAPVIRIIVLFNPTAQVLRLSHVGFSGYLASQHIGNKNSHLVGTCGELTADRSTAELLRSDGKRLERRTVNCRDVKVATEGL